MSLICQILYKTNIFSGYKCCLEDRQKHRKLTLKKAFCPNTFCWFIGSRLFVFFKLRMNQKEASLSRRAVLLVRLSAGSLRFRVQLRTASAVACCPICPALGLLAVCVYIWPRLRFHSQDTGMKGECYGSPGKQKVAVTILQNRCMHTKSIKLCILLL